MNKLVGTVTPLQGSFLWISFVGVAGTVCAITFHDWFRVSAYALILAIGIGSFCVARGMASGYVEARRSVGDEVEAAAMAAVEAADEARRAAQMPRQIATDFPVAFPGEGFLYILRFSAGGVKVGQTSNLRRRLSEHRRDGEAYGVVITDYWVSPAHKNYLDNEIELIGFCDGISTTRAKREYFHGIEYGDVVRFAAKRLRYYTDDPAVTGANR